MKDRKKIAFLPNVYVEVIFLENKVSLKIELKYFLMGIIFHTRCKIILECLGKN